MKALFTLLFMLTVTGTMHQALGHETGGDIFGLANKKPVLGDIEAEYMFGLIPQDPVVVFKNKKSTKQIMKEREVEINRAARDPQVRGTGVSVLLESVVKEDEIYRCFENKILTGAETDRLGLNRKIISFNYICILKPFTYPKHL